MVKEQYVSFEVAKLLNDKGFDLHCRTAYSTIGSKHELEDAAVSEWGKANQVMRPTMQLALCWLREVHHWHIDVFVANDSSNDSDGNTVEEWYFWSFSINALPSGKNVYDESALFSCVEYQSYEEATEAAVKYCLENFM